METDTPIVDDSRLRRAARHCASDDTTFVDPDSHIALLAYTRPAANCSSPTGERPTRHASRPNMLVVGSPADVEDALAPLASDAPTTVHDWTPDSPMPSCDRSSVVIIRNVDRVPLALQDVWLSWLTDSHDRPQIIATSYAPVFPLVGAGLFRSELYYRLNTVLLDLRARP